MVTSYRTRRPCDHIVNLHSSTSVIRIPSQSENSVPTLALSFPPVIWDTPYFETIGKDQAGTVNRFLTQHKWRGVSSVIILCVFYFVITVKWERQNVPLLLLLVVAVVVVVVVVVVVMALCKVFTLIYIKQAMSPGNTVLQLFCSYCSWCI
jgi:hypothetical protein